MYRSVQHALAFDSCNREFNRQHGFVSCMHCTFSTSSDFPTNQLAFCSIGSAHHSNNRQNRRSCTYNAGACGVFSRTQFQGLGHCLENSHRIQRSLHLKVHSSGKPYQYPGPRPSSPALSFSVPFPFDLGIWTPPCFDHV